jgi:phage/plasmid primase-like uncharacterized protein
MSTKYSADATDRQAFRFTKNISAATIIEALGGNPATGMCKCPAHDDRTPSLRIADGESRVLIHCFAGCASTDVIERLRQRGLWPSPEQQRTTDEAIERTSPEAEKPEVDALARAKKMWADADDASPDHSYCVRKQVEPDGLGSMRFKDGTSLLVPVLDANEELLSLQLIREDGKKTFMKNCRTGGGHLWLCEPNPDPAGTICICEGWATGESTYQATKHAVTIAFSAGNLLAVAEWVRARYPQKKITLCADDDWRTDGNPGLTKAREAAAKVGGYLAVPVFGAERGEKDTDFNDMARATGAGSVWAAIDAAVFVEPNKDAAEDNEADEVVKKQTDLLVELAAKVEFYHTSADVAWADVDVKDHRETHSVRSSKFRTWLVYRYYQLIKSVPNDTAVKNAIALLEARAKFDGVEREVYLRVAGHEGRIYLDLCDANWRAVEIDAEGWRVVARPPARFYRRAGTLPLPEPVRGGSIEMLRPYLNLKKDDEFVLGVSWELAAMRPERPYPVLEINGREGTAKTTALRVFRKLVDPNMSALRGPPRDERDLVIAASNGHVLGYDNLSTLPDWLSDALARISTGGGFATRALYTDDDERLFADMRPILLGGINDVVVRGDLASRTIRLQLEEIPDSKRLTEEEFWRKFNVDYPSILGALLDAVSYGLRELPNVTTESLPRMADFAQWAIACEGALWPPGTFMRVYRNNLDAVTRAVVEADLVGAAILRMMTERDNDKWSGTATELLRLLEAQAGERTAKSRHWPQSSKSLGWRLRSMATSLKRLGIEIDHETRGARRYTITKIEGSGQNAENAETPKTPPPEQNAEQNAAANPLKNKEDSVSGVSGVFSPAKESAARNAARNAEQNAEQNAADEADAAPARPSRARYKFKYMPPDAPA